MSGGSLTGTTLGGIDFSGSNNVVDLSNVTITSGGVYGVANHNLGSNNNVLNLYGGSITHASTNGNAAVHFGGSGNLLIDGTIVKATGLGHAVLVGSTNGTSSLTARNNFDFETNANSAVGVNINNNGIADLKDGKITTKGNGAIGIRIFSTANATTPLTAERVTVETSGANAHGIYSDVGQSTLRDVDIKVNGQAIGLASLNPNTDIQMTGGSIHAAGAGAIAAFAHGGGRIGITGGDIHATGVNAVAAWAQNGGHIELDGVTANSLNNTTGGSGVRIQSGTSALLKNKTTVTTDGALAPGLVFLGATAANVITVDDSTVTAQDSFAVLANGGTDTLNVANQSLIRGDRLAYAGNCAPPTCASTFGSRLTIHANDSQLVGHTDVSAQSRLHMNLDNHSVWTLRPSAGGLAQSHTSFLDIKNSHIVFDQNSSGLYQTLRVGAGDTGGNMAVYHAGPGAAITLNTLLNTGGALSNQQTDRVLIEGDVSGTTLLHIREVAGSPGGLTSPSGAYLASEGISVVQASGAATENSFALAGGYVTMNSLPYQYTLYAYGPGSHNGPADASQKQVGGAGHWDWRLQSGSGSGSGSAPALVPQASNYLLAPGALFQAGLTDIGTLHRRLGDIRRRAAEPDKASQGEFFLRSYGGVQDYRANLHVSPYTPNADMRYAALQIGANLWGMDTSQHRLRVGLAGNRGALSFTPRDVADSRRTHMTTWAVSPTLTYQHESGGYVDGLTSHGAFQGKVATRLRGKTATLKGRSTSASVETGLPFGVGMFTVTPQVQLTYQRLRFDNTRDVDNFPVEAGTLRQWTLRTGTDIQTQLSRIAGGAITLRGSLHLTQPLASRQTINLGEDFYLSKPGATLDAGLGVDAVFAKGHAMLYGEFARQQRISSAGHQGWMANFGLKVAF
ncbi:autotransporter outer membrane beta-barrel domain-containing protein [Ventosimonas gracilis]